MSDTQTTTGRTLLQQQSDRPSVREDALTLITVLKVNDLHGTMNAVGKALGWGHNRIDYAVYTARHHFNVGIVCDQSTVPHRWHLPQT